MIIKKYLHSCILVEKNGKRLLVDPGWFSFVEERIKPEDIGPVDVIVLTHSHPDHFYPDALKKIIALQQTRIITHAELGVLLDKEGLAWEAIQEGETKGCAGFRITALHGPHEKLPLPCPQNCAYYIDDTLLLPGDSYNVEGLDHCDVLALPVAGPWSRLADGVDFAKALRPRIVIPIHDWIIKDIFLERIYGMCRAVFAKEGIQFQPLGLGEGLEIEQ